MHEQFTSVSGLLSLMSCRRACEGRDKSVAFDELPGCDRHSLGSDIYERVHILSRIVDVICIFLATIPFT